MKLDNLPPSTQNNSRSIVRGALQRFKNKPCDRIYTDTERIMGSGDWNNYDVVCDPPENNNH